MSARSQRKFARGERECRDKLRAAGFAAERRGYQQRRPGGELIAVIGGKILLALLETSLFKAKKPNPKIQ